MLRARHPHRGVGPDEFRPAHVVDNPVGGRQLNPQFPFFRIDSRGGLSKGSCCSHAPIIARFALIARPDGTPALLELTGPRTLTAKVCIVDVEPRLTNYPGIVMVRRLRQPLTAEQFRIVHDAFVNYEVIVLRDQDITVDQQMAFGGLFGELSIHPFSPNLADKPEVIILDYSAPYAGT